MEVTAATARQEPRAETTPTRRARVATRVRTPKTINQNVICKLEETTIIEVLRRQPVKTSSPVAVVETTTNLNEKRTINTVPLRDADNTQQLIWLNF
jgi:hypothetical protein